jgi:hypothetical protein
MSGLHPTVRHGYSRQVFDLYRCQAEIGPGWTGALSAGYFILNIGPQRLPRAVQRYMQFAWAVGHIAHVGPVGVAGRDGAEVA